MWAHSCLAKKYLFHPGRLNLTLVTLGPGPFSVPCCTARHRTLTASSASAHPAEPERLQASPTGRWHQRRTEKRCFRSRVTEERGPAELVSVVTGIKRPEAAFLNESKHPRDPHTATAHRALCAPRTPRLSPNPRQSDQVQHDPDSWPSSSASGTTTCHLPGWPTAPTRCLPQCGSPLMPRGRDPVAPAIGLLRSSNTGSPLPGSGPRRPASRAGFPSRP